MRSSSPKHEESAKKARTRTTKQAMSTKKSVRKDMLRLCAEWVKRAKKEDRQGWSCRGMEFVQPC